MSPFSRAVAVFTFLTAAVLLTSLPAAAVDGSIRSDSRRADAGLPRVLATGSAAQGEGDGAGGARPQGPRVVRRGQPGIGGASMSAAQAEQLFDRYVLGQAQVALQLSPSQMLTFGPRLERLQMVRRTAQRRRQVLLNELTALTRGGGGGANDDAVAAKLQALDDLALQADRQIRQAASALEETLNVRQRARFRTFERRMERQKLELIARARQEARQAGQQP